MMARWFRALGFDSQHPNSGERTSVTSVPEHPVPISGLCEYQAHTRYTDIHALEDPYA